MSKLSAFFFGGAILLLASFATAEVPPLINYQGRLTGPGGEPLDTIISMTFAVYDDSTDEIPIWTETHDSVIVANGIFNVILGSVETKHPFDVTISDGETVIGITVGDDPEIEPRTRFTSSPYAIHSGSVDGFHPGPNNIDSGMYAFVAGDSNTVVGKYGSISGGFGNTVRILDSIIDLSFDTTDTDDDKGFDFGYESSRGSCYPSGPGLCDDCRLLWITDGEILGGKYNVADMGCVVGGGCNNHAHWSFSTIAGGGANNIDDKYSFIGGGYCNHIFASLVGTEPYKGQTISGGIYNCTDAYVTTIGGGAFNSIENTSQYATIGGGGFNNICDNNRRSVIGGGSGNTIHSYSHTSVIGGGHSNDIMSRKGTISGGWQNLIDIGMYSTIGGGSYNKARAGYATISGGGRSDPNDNATGNHVYDGWGTIGGGGNNKAGSFNSISDDIYATIAGGHSNQASGPYSTICGGDTNVAESTYTTVGGGGYNMAIGEQSTIAGGFRDTASGEASVVAGGYTNAVHGHYSAIGGGFFNRIGTLRPPANDEGRLSFIGGGYYNLLYGQFATIGGGSRDTVLDNYGTIGGGAYNRTGTDNSDHTDSHFQTIGGGRRNVAEGSYSTIGGGITNFVNTGKTYGTIGGGESDTVDQEWGTIGGGSFNRVLEITSGGYGGTIGGGMSNTVTDTAGTIAGGEDNTVSSAHSFIGGGLNNQANNIAGAVAGGRDNTVDGIYGGILGGYNNTILASSSFSWIGGGQNVTVKGDYSFAGGKGATANYDGTFIWADASGDELESTAPNQFIIRASGGTKIYSSADHTAGVTIHNGSSAWAVNSDKNLKENFQSVDGAALLEKVAALNITRWNYKTQNEEIKHIGPTAQDFYASFGLGDDDVTISTIDPAGVALAAAKELYKRNKELEAEVSELKDMVQQLLDQNR